MASLRAHDAYLRELNGRLLPAIGEEIRQRLIANTADPDKLYEYLKAYLMLGQPEHLDKTQLGFVVDLDWNPRFPNDQDLRDSLSRHFASLVQRQSKLRPLPLPPLPLSFLDRPARFELLDRPDLGRRPVDLGLVGPRLDRGEVGGHGGRHNPRVTGPVLPLRG